MGDGISFRMDTRQFTTGIRRRVDRMPAAARWTVREAGRAVARTARDKAPILKTVPRASRASDPPIPGLLKASIRPSRQLSRTAASVFSLKVGPRGPRVHLYAQKEERRTGYMAAGHAAGRIAMERAARDAFGRVWKG